MKTFKDVTEKKYTFMANHSGTNIQIKGLSDGAIYEAVYEEFGKLVKALKKNKVNISSIDIKIK